MLAPRLSTRLPFYYGWIIVGISSIILIVAFGIRLSFSVFFVALINDFGWSRASTSLIFSTTMITFAIGSTLSGLALDRFGARLTFSIGALILGLGLTLSSQIQTLTQLTISYGVIAGLGITILGLSMHASLMARWFRRRLGTAIGIAFAGTGIGALFLTPTVELIIRTYNWRLAFTVLAGLTFILIPFIFLIVAQEPSSLGLMSRKRNGRKQEKDTQIVWWTFRRTIKTPSFWLLMVAGLCTMAPVRMLTVHQLAIMDDAGIPTEIGARAVGLSGAVTAITFILAGVLSDRIGRSATFAIGGVCLLGAIFTIGLLKTSQLSLLIWIYAALLGIGEGSRSSLIAATVGDLFNGPTLGAINGTVGAAYGAGAAVMPWLAGLLFDQMGSYQLPLWLAAITAVTAVVTLILARKFHPATGLHYLYTA
jgi:MFS family permease